MSAVSEQAEAMEPEIGTRVKHIVNSKAFFWTIFITIMLSSILLGMDSPYAPYAESDPWVLDLINGIDVVCTVIFTGEAVLLILAKGAEPYFTSPRNVFQFIIVIGCWIDTIFWAAGYETRGAAVIGSLRAARPLVFLTFQKDMRNILRCLWKATMGLSSIGALLIFFFVIFGLMGMQLFPGVLRYRCAWNGTDTLDYMIDGTNLTLGDFGYAVQEGNNSRFLEPPSDGFYFVNCGNASDTQQCASLYPEVISIDGENYTIPVDCLDTEEQPDIVNFDNFLWAMITLFQCVMAVGWTDTMYKIQDAAGWYYVIYFTAVMVIGLWVILNLAVAVLADTYNASQAEQEEEEKSERIAQRQSLRENKGNGGISWGKKKTPLEKWKTVAMSQAAKERRAPLTRIVEHIGFKAFILVLIAGNTLLLALHDPYRCCSEQKGYEIAGWVFAAFFAVEMFLKWGGLSIYGYFEDSSNWFDFFLVQSMSQVVLSFVELMLIAADVKSLALSSVRAFRVLRMFRLAQGWEAFQNVLLGTLRSLKAVTAIGVVLFVYLYVASILGMQLFGGIYGSGGIMAHNVPYHFDYFIVSFATVFQVVTTENWTGVMWSAYLEQGGYAIAYFIAVIIAGNIIVFNMFLAILCDQMAVELEAKRAAEELERKLARSSHAALPPGDNRPESTPTKLLEFEENRAARKFQDTFRASKFITKLRKKVAETEVKQAGSMIGLQGYSFTGYPMLESWEVSIYTIEWTKATQSTGGKLRYADVEDFLRLIGQRLKHAPEAISSSVNDTLKDLKNADMDGDGFIALPEVLGLLNRKKKLEDDLLGKKREKQTALSMDERIKQKENSQLPRRGICCDPLVRFQKPLEGISCGCLGSTNPFRKLALLAYLSPLRRFLTSVFIFVSGSFAGLRFTQTRADGYRTDLEQNMGTPNFDAMIFAVDGIFEVLLILEIALRMIAYGLYWADPQRSYFRNKNGLTWRLIDCTVAFLTFFALLMDFADATPSDDSSSARPYKSVQSIKLLSLIPRIRATKVMVSSLMVAMPKVSMMLIATAMMLLVFSIMGVFLFGGTFGSCSVANYTLAPPDVEDEFGRVLPDQIPNRTVCEATPGMDWSVPTPNFDHLGRAMLALFQVMFIDGWSGILYYATSARDIELQPKPESQMFMPLVFFWFWVVLGALFFLNLIVGSVVSTFIELLNVDSGMDPLTEDQRQWVYTQQVLQGASMFRLLHAPESGCLVSLRRKCFLLVVRKEHAMKHSKAEQNATYYGAQFEAFIMTVIVFNVVSMLAYQPGTSMDSIFTFFSMVCGAIYAFEFFAKVGGLGWKQYWRNSWNRFDAALMVVQLGTAAATAAVYFLGTEPTSYNFGYIRAFRALRLGRYSKSVRMMALTLKFGLPAILNVTLVLYIIGYIFAMLGMTLFGGMVHATGGGEICGVGAHANFDTVYMAMQTVFRLASGDCWSGFYLDAANVRFPPNILPVNEIYVHLYIVIFMFVSLVLVSVFIAILLEYYGIQSALVISESETSLFAEIWVDYDPDNTGYMPVWRLGEFIIRLGPPWCPVDLRPPKETLNPCVKTPEPLSDDERAVLIKKLGNFLHKLGIPVRAGGKMHFMEVVVALAEMKEGRVLPEVASKVQNGLVAKWPKLAPDLLSLPHKEGLAATFYKEMIDVVKEEANWEELQKAYIAKLEAPPAKAIVRRGSATKVSEERLSRTPSLKKLSMLLDSTDMDLAEIQAEADKMAMPTITETSSDPTPPLRKAPTPYLNGSSDISVPVSIPPAPLRAKSVTMGGAVMADAMAAMYSAEEGADEPRPSILKQDKAARAGPQLTSGPLVEAWLRIKADLFAEDGQRNLTALVLIRKLLSSKTGRTQHMQAFKRVLATECVARFVLFLQEVEDPKVQQEAAWVLTHLCSDVDYVQAVVEHGALPVVVQLARTKQDSVAVQALHAIGNIAKDAELREMLMVQGALQTVLERLDPRAKIVVLRMAAWALAALCGASDHGPGRAYSMVAPSALTVLPDLLGSEDDQLLTNVCAGLGALCDSFQQGGDLSHSDRIDAVISTGCLPRIAELMARPGDALPQAALRIMANIVTGSDEQAQAVLDANALPGMLALLKHPDRTVRKECCWALSSIMAGTEQQVQSVVEANIMAQVVKLLVTEDHAIQKEAGWCIINAVTGGNAEQIALMVEQGCIKALCDLLVRPDLVSTLQPLEALEYVLRRGAHNGTESVYLPLIDLHKLKALGEHKNPDVRKRSMRILEKVVAAAPFFGSGGEIIPQKLLQSSMEPEDVNELSVDKRLMLLSDGPQETWASKWSRQEEELAREAAEEDERAVAAETLADAIYLDFFDGDDPFGILAAEAAEEDEDEDQTGGAPTGKSKPRRHKTGKGGLARQTTAHGAQLSSTNV